MDEEERKRRMMMESLTSSFDNKYPRDLLQRLKNDTSQMKYEEHELELELEQEQELELGLSLGGRFGVDKTKKLTRSSSISVTMPFFREQSHDDGGDAPAPAYGGLMRSSSLPTETEEEWRKRKELWTLRRLAAKRRRSEKQRSSGAAEAPDNKEEDEVVGPNSGNPFWAAKGRNDILGGFQGFGLQSSSMESSSQGRSSSGLSEMESKFLQGSGSCGEVRSPASNKDHQSNQGTVLRSLGSLTPEHASRISRVVMNMREKPITSEDKGRETRMNHMEDMPCVFTKGDGPNGRKIEGILYRYAKGEEVRIMCVCHGTFLSPAEFVKHAGGGEVTNPLRHIVVNPTATSFL